MKKLICIMLCLLVLAGCSGEKDKNPVTDKNTQNQAEVNNPKEDD